MTQDSSAPQVQPPEVSPRQLARNTLLTYTNSVVTLVNGVVLSIIIARRLGPAQLGVYSGLSFVIGLSIALCSLGIGATIIKILSEYSARFDNAVITRLVRLFAFGAIIPAAVSGLAAWVALHLTNHDQRYDALLIGVGTLSALPAYLAQIYRAIANGLQDFGFLLRVNLIAALVLSGATLAVVLVHPGIVGLVLVGMLPNALVAGSLAARYKRHLFGRVEAVPLPREHIAELLSYLWPVALISVLDMVVWQYSEVLFLSSFRPPQEVAFYTLAFSTSSLILRGVASSVTATFVPALSQLHGQGEHARIELGFYAALRLSVLVTLPLIAMIAVVARPLILLFYGEAYLAVSFYVPALVIGAGVGTIASVAADVMYSLREQRRMLQLSASVAVLNIGLDAWLIPAHGVPGAVVANVIAQVSCGLVTLSFVCLRYRQPLSLRSYLGPVLAALLVVACTAPLAQWLHGIPAIVAIGVVGSAAYLLAVRLLGALSNGDGRLLASIAQHVPNPLIRRTFGGVLRFCAPGAYAP